MDQTKEMKEMNKPLNGQIVDRLRSLSAGQRRRVLSFVRGLAQAPSAGVPGKELLRFAGTIPAKDLEQIKAAISHSCEQVDSDAW